MELHERIKLLRSHLNKSQIELAKELNIAASTYQYYERGERSIPSDIIEKILKQFFINPEWLFNETGDIFSRNALFNVDNNDSQSPNWGKIKIGYAKRIINAYQKAKKDIYGSLLMAYFSAGDINAFLAERKIPTNKLLQTVQNDTGVSREYLEGKEEPIEIPTVSNKQSNNIKNIFGSNSTQTDDIVQNYDFIKFYNVKVSAGFGVDTDEEEKSILLPVEKDFIRQIGYPKEDLSFVAVEGDSMEPTLRNGDRVIVYIPKGPISFVPAIYVIRDAAGVKVKRLDNDKNGSLEVSSDNKFYKTKIYSPDEVNSGNVTIIGRVVGKIGVM